MPAPWLRLTMMQVGSASAAPHRGLRAQAFEARIAGAKHDALHPPPARHQFETVGEEWRIVGLGVLVEQMDRRQIAFAALGRRQAAEAADRDRAHGQACARERRRDQIEPGAVAADDDEIRHPHMWREQRHLGISPRPASDRRAHRCFRKPSAWAKEVIAPEPLPEG